MSNDGLTLNQLAERNAVLVTEVEKLRAERDQLAAENVALKDINAWCKTDAFKNMFREFKTAESLGCSDVDCMHDAMLVAIMHAPETHTTDRIVAGIKADGVDEFAAKLRIPGDDQFFDALAKGVAIAADDFAKQLREGSGK
ncbi:hypothetical protein PTC90_14565 [Klebsiella grimontii]|uniref:hypothetical protein n=1 Tax=Klebsiella grimontii TaxID=2058152 RepID=UPI002361AD4E|nr:hypothetical protein [Klebsiella grimontii]WDC40642.1 hypothetical protein PTC90_14565 [Klebsiella grimontii]